MSILAENDRADRRVWRSVAREQTFGALGLLQREW
jgi:hypothetical protein